MKLFKLLAILLLTPVVTNAEMTWYVYISTDLPHFYQSGERVITSTGTVEIQPLVDDPNFSCKAREPYYFQPEGFPYPLMQHRYLECNLGKDYAVATQVGCELKHDEVKEANLILQTPNFLYGISFQCYNHLEENK